MKQSDSLFLSSPPGRALAWALGDTEGYRTSSTLRVYCCFLQLLANQNTEAQNTSSTSGRDSPDAPACYIAERWRESRKGGREGKLRQLFVKVSASPGQADGAARLKLVDFKLRSMFGPSWLETNGSWQTSALCSGSQAATI